MSKREAPESSKEFEAPELTLVGDVGEVILGVPASGWDFRGYSPPGFEFESDEEQS